jgi:outer membrane protein TolC
MWIKAVFQVVILTAVILPGTASLQAQPRSLTLDDAIRAALENNADVGLAEEVQIQAGARADEQRAALLPNIGGLVSYTNQTLNPGSRGLDFPGIPHLFGPFNNVEARFQFSEPVFDLSLLRRYRSARQTAGSSDFDTQAIRNRVAAMVATLYYGVQRARASVDAASAQVTLDESLLRLATDRRDAGAGTGLDVTRAQARLAADAHRLVESRNAARTAEFRLLRAIGEPLDTPLDLTDPLATSVVQPPTVAEALATATRNRPELRAEETRINAARLTLGAASAESLPNLHAFGDYGNSGDATTFIPTRTIGVQLNIPIFEGGRRSARREITRSQLRQAEIRAEDARDQVEVEVRIAVDALVSAQELLRSAEQSLRLAEEELELSRLRFEAQVTTQIDVIGAQVSLAAARFRHVDALFGVRSAEIEYRRAVGAAW